MRFRKWLSGALNPMVALVVLPQIEAAQTLFHDRCPGAGRQNRRGQAVRVFTAMYRRGLL